jgi:hypothetical protein
MLPEEKLSAQEKWSERSKPQLRTVDLCHEIAKRFRFGSQLLRASKFHFASIP